MFEKEIILKTENDTKNLAEKIAQILDKKDFIALKGDLGAGKTFFSRSLIRFLGNNKQDVPSPTFTLVQTYDLPKFTLWHFDFYRIKHKEEIYELDWEDAIYDGVILAEWPEKLDNLIPENRLEIEISFSDKKEERNVVIKAFGNMEKKINGCNL